MGEGMPDLTVRVEVGGVLVAFVTVQENTGFVLAALLQALSGGPCTHTGVARMPMSAQLPARMDGPAGHGGPAIAGFIQPARTPLSEAIEAWSADMTRRSVKPGSRRQFERTVMGCAAWADWKGLEDITLASASGYLGAKRAAGWTGSTHDGAVTHLRCFSRFLFRHGHLADDRLVNLERCGEQGEQGSRALTLDEVRRLVRVAHDSTRLDGRGAKVNRAAFYTFLALTGVRSEDEAAGVCWKDLDLDAKAGPVAALYTDPKWAKNGRRQRVVLNVEVAGVLQAHRNTVAAGPLDRVWPVLPTRKAFISDRRRAEVPDTDARGRPAGRHGLRKFLATILDQTGASPGVVARIMRHANGITQERYIDPPAEEEYEAVCRIPPLWPCQISRVPQTPVGPLGFSESVSKTVANGQSVGDTPAATSDAAMSITIPHESTLRTAPAVGMAADVALGAARLPAGAALSAVIQGSRPAALASFLRGLADLLDVGAA